MKACIASFLLVFASSYINAQPYRKGEVIIANVFYGGCVKVTVTGTDPAYSVHIEDGMYKGRDTFYNANRIAECKQDGDGNAVVHPEPRNDAVDRRILPLGTRVDVYETPDRAKDRGTIVDANATQYKVHYDGCEAKFDSWEDRSRVEPAASVGIDDPDIRYLFGRWSMVTSSMSNSVIAWGRAPGLEIKGDGTYLWYQNGGKPAVKGKWQTYAKLRGVNKFNVGFANGVLVTDAAGYGWKVFRSAGRNDQETISVNQLCMAARRETGFRAH